MTLICAVRGSHCLRPRAASSAGPISSAGVLMRSRARKMPVGQPLRPARESAPSGQTSWAKPRLPRLVAGEGIGAERPAQREAGRRLGRRAVERVVPLRQRCRDSRPAPRADRRRLPAHQHAGRGAPSSSGNQQRACPARRRSRVASAQRSTPRAPQPLAGVAGRGRRRITGVEPETALACGRLSNGITKSVVAPGLANQRDRPECQDSRWPTSPSISATRTTRRGRCAAG